ncbi:MAG TPA: PDZ domain-containing protein [Pyrinomonadaceae bacterium]|nr:PDZ domain-containing protein [Pyrinomonadaceae bacterium]
METETQRAGRDVAATKAQEVCPSCGAALVDGMRFCRMCGYRLGEGMAEYVETVRFDQMANMQGVGQNQPLAPTGAQTTLISPVAAMQPPVLSGGGRRRRRKTMKWMTVVVLFFVLIPLVGLGGRLAFRSIRDAAQRSGAFQQQRDVPRSFFGAEEFGDTEGQQGALVAGAMPGSPAERAKLLDGDIITKFDGKPVNGEDAMREVLRATPIGKTVEVEYLRDGETKTTQLTTVSSADYNSDAFMPKEKGMLGIEATDRVAVEGTKIYGLRLGEVYPNRPADLAGLKEGDVVVEFDGKPVRTEEGLFGYINRAKPASTVDVVVYREGQRIVIPVKMGRRQ